MNHRRFLIASCRLKQRLVMAGLVLLGASLFAADALARGGGGRGAGALLYLLIRFLLWLTIEHPVIGIPVDIIVVVLVIYWFARPSRKAAAVDTSSMLGVGAATAAARQQGFQRE